MRLCCKEIKSDKGESITDSGSNYEYNCTIRGCGSGSSFRKKYIIKKKKKEWKERQRERGREKHMFILYGFTRNFWFKIPSLANVS